jgi:putative transposase
MVVRAAIWYRATRVIRSFRYRLVPTKAQAATLMAWLAVTRELYNAALQERQDAWARQRVRCSRFSQFEQIPKIRSIREDVAAVPVVVLRGALRRIDEAFAGFFRRCKLGEKPGYPRFRGRGRWHSLLIDDVGRKTPIAQGGKRVAIPLLGKVKLKMHRPMLGTPKAMRLTLDAGGRWFVTFACVDVPKAEHIESPKLDVGVDLGLTTFAATSDGQQFASPRALATARLDIERAQRRVSRRKRGSRRRNKARVLLAKQHAHVANLRREHAIGVARALVSQYQTIYVEDLNIQSLARSTFAKSIHDAAWGIFLNWLRTKAESAGREVVEVNPRGTSQTCSGCGAIVTKGLSVRVHRCPHCGLELDRDVNAARNILRLGRSLRGAAPLVEGRQ